MADQAGRSRRVTLATFFEWQVKEGREDEFRDAWASVTRRLHARGSQGSSLFVNEAGHYCAFALWPDRATRDAAFALDDPLPDDSARMRACVERTVHRMDMDRLDDLWLR